MQSWPALINSIPTAVTNAARVTVQPKIGMYVVFMPEEDEPNFYARVEDDGSGNPNQFKFHILKIDTFGSPHETGKYVSTMRALRTSIAEATL